MNTVQYVTREYVPSVDLNTLGKTFDTLEQGHKEAVKAASDLEVTMANLPLNEAENEWRQQKINEIKKTIDDNTIFGNSYAALDNLILKSGDLMSDQGMIGRLQAQKDFKDFEARILNNNSLPQNYKEYFLENNPYYYKDKYDKNGNLIGGTKWSPTVSPTTVINPMELLNQALKIASEDAGSYTRYRWLDENGNITNDYRKSVVGEYFDATTSQWQRLSEDKIRAALNSVIKATPGAKESLLQDYNVSLWYGKKNNIDTDAYKDDIPVTFDEYIENKFEGAIKSSAYSKNFTDIKMGGALSSYRQLQLANAADLTNTSPTNQKSNNGAKNTNNTIAASLNMLTKVPSIEYNVNVGNSHLNNFINTQNEIYRLLEVRAGYKIKPFDNNALVSIDNVLDFLKKNNRLDDAAVTQIHNLVRQRNNALTNYKMYLQKIPQADLDFVNEYNSLVNGRNFSPKTAYGKSINADISAIKNGKLRITVTNRMKPIIDSYFQNDNIKRVFGEYYQSKIGTFEIDINQNTRRLLPGLSRLLTDIENESNKGFLNTFATKRYKAEINGTDVRENLSNINNNFVYLINKVDNINKNINANNKVLISTPAITDAKSFTEKILKQELAIGNINASTYNTNVRTFNTGIENSVRHALTGRQGEFLYSENGKHYAPLSQDKQDEIIASATNILSKGNKYYALNPQIILDRTDIITGAPAMAYNLSWNEDGVDKSLIISGAIDESSAKDFLNSNYMMAFRDINAAASASGYIRLNDESSHLGAVSVQGKNGNLSLLINGRNKKTISVENGIELANAFNVLDNIKYRYINDENYIKNPNVVAELDNCINTIVRYTDIPEHEVIGRINKDFNPNQ